MSQLSRYSKIFPQLAFKHKHLSTHLLIYQTLIYPSICLPSCIQPYIYPSIIHLSSLSVSLSLSLSVSYSLKFFHPSNINVFSIGPSPMSHLVNMYVHSITQPSEAMTHVPSPCLFLFFYPCAHTMHQYSTH